MPGNGEAGSHRSSVRLVPINALVLTGLTNFWVSATRKLFQKRGCGKQETRLWRIVADAKLNFVCPTCRDSTASRFSPAAPPRTLPQQTQSFLPRILLRVFFRSRENSLARRTLRHTRSVTHFCTFVQFHPLFTRRKINRDRQVPAFSVRDLQAYLRSLGTVSLTPGRFGCPALTPSASSSFSFLLLDALVRQPPLGWSEQPKIARPLLSWI